MVSRPRSARAFFLTLFVKGAVRGFGMFWKAAPLRGQRRLSWGRPAPALRGLQEAPPVLIAGRNGCIGRRESGRGEPRLDMECISFGPREERNPAETTESIEKEQPHGLPRSLATGSRLHPKGDLVWTGDSVGGTPTEATSSFAIRLR